MATLERIILFNARLLFKNQKLRMKDIQEWSSGTIDAHANEVVAHLPDPGVWVAIKLEHDKRKGV